MQSLFAVNNVFFHCMLWLSPHHHNAHTHQHTISGHISKNMSAEDAVETQLCYEGGGSSGDGSIVTVLAPVASAGWKSSGGHWFHTNKC